MKTAMILIGWSCLLAVVGRVCLKRPAGPRRVYLFLLCNGVWLTGLFWLLQRLLGGGP